MILGFLRLAVVVLIGLTIVYFSMGLYWRSVRREELEKEWDTDPAREGVPASERQAFIDEGMNHYETGLKKKLLWLIYIVPMVVFCVIVYAVNW
jgi:hypothetical protein